MTCRSLSLALACLLVPAGRSHAALPFPSVVEHVVGARVDVAPVRAALGDTPAAWRVEVADAELYGVTGLRSSGARACGLFRSLILSASVVHVSSPVGTHARAVVEGGFAIQGAWQGAIRAGAERLELAGADAVTWRVAGLVSRTDVGRVSILADVDVVEGHGAYDTSMSLAARVRAGAAQVVGSVRIDGDRFMGAAVSIVARVHPGLALLAGYDDGAESLRAGVVVGWKGIEIATGVSQHPVLGLSQGVSVACGR